MTAELFHVVETNPNDAVGGGGCVCSESDQSGCTGPYAVFYANEMANNLSPHCVLGLGCAKAFVDQASSQPALAGGERGDTGADEDIPEL